MLIEKLPQAALLLILGAVSACGARAAGTRGAAPTSADGIAHWLPLEADTVLSYDTTREPSGERGVIVLQIARPREGRVEVRGGVSTERLDVDARSVRYASGGTWLELPLEVGRCWAGRIGETCVTNVRRVVSVPQGKFEGCVETQEKGTGTRVTTVFCPRVGMVLLDAEGSLDGEAVRERAELRTHGPRVDIATE
jgi:hypothetical protein